MLHITYMYMIKTQVNELYDVTVGELSLQFISRQFILLLLIFNSESIGYCSDTRVSDCTKPSSRSKTPVLMIV